jgi:hypothetical protein
VDALADGVVHGHVLDLGWGGEADLQGPVAGGELPADELAGEADGELLADLAVAVLDHLPRVAVDTHDGRGLDTRPVSSLTSRTTVSAMRSPASIAPPGIDHSLVSSRRCSRIAPAWSTTTAEAAGTRLVAFGALGSL